MASDRKKNASGGREKVFDIDSIDQALRSGDLNRVMATIESILPENIVKEAAQKITEKGVVDRFKQYVEIQNDLLQIDKSLVAGTDLQSDVAQYRELISHVEKLWDDSSRLFNDGSYPASLFFAIVCIEETGKISVTRFQILIRESERHNPPQKRTQKKASRRKNPFYSHFQKHLLAAGAGALINSRLDRIVGQDRVLRFLEDVESGRIENLRQSCIYADHDGSRLMLPYNDVSREEATFYVVLAGELMAEILGFEHVDYKRLIEKVECFELQTGLELSKS